MTDHDDDVEAGQDRPKVRIVDKRRFRESDEAQDPAEAAASAGSSASPEAATSELEQANAKAAEYLDHLQRLQAEFDNYRKRVLKEQTRAVEMAAQPVVARLLEVLDEFDLALMAAERSPDLEQFRKGVELVYVKLMDSLRAEGLERIEAEGKVFDPTEHEALMQTGDGEGDPHVAEVFRQGYKLKGSVLRPASVRVERR
ncbi:MAG: nucleotide exchange factor GrpE [Actinobacteria bacterium]|nr:nucleotide exchange factor GrpE [Actinomycetota bacterium]